VITSPIHQKVSVAGKPEKAVDPSSLSLWSVYHSKQYSSKRHFLWPPTAKPLAVEKTVPQFQPSVHFSALNLLYHPNLIRLIRLSVSIIELHVKITSLVV